MKNKWDIHFCHCGRIHVREWQYDWLAVDHENRSVVDICNNCGDITRTTVSPYDHDGFTANSTRLHDTSFEGMSRIYASHGIKVYMMSGNVADTCQNGYFANCGEWAEEEKKPDWVCLDTAEKTRLPWATVDTERLIEDVKRDFKENADMILRAISGYGVKIHWTGTPYEKSYNK